MKKVMKIFVLVAIFILNLSLTSFASEQPVSVCVNDVYLDFDVQPKIENGRTLVPVRAISEYLKYDVEWNPTNQMVKIQNEDTILNIYIGNINYQLNGEAKTFDVPPKIENGRTLVPVRLIAESFGCDVEWEPDARNVKIVKYNVVEVETAEEFVESIDSYTKIILTNSFYNLSTVEEVNNHNIFKEYKIEDEYEYVVVNVNNLIIEAKEQAEIVTAYRYSNVLNFTECINITLKNITAGHAIEKGYCVGGVLYFEETEKVNVENCKLYGCGTYGVIARYSRDMNITNTDIYECTYGALDLETCADIKFDSCIFRDTEFFALFNISGEFSNIVIKNSVIKNNTCYPDYAEYCPLIDSDGGLTFENCEFSNNDYVIFDENNNAIFNNCKY